jgi:hypothetical protein
MKLKSLDPQFKESMVLVAYRDGTRRIGAAGFSNTDRLVKANVDVSIERGLGGRKSLNSSISDIV